DFATYCAIRSVLISSATEGRRYRMRRGTIHAKQGSDMSKSARMRGRSDAIASIKPASRKRQTLSTAKTKNLKVAPPPPHPLPGARGSDQINNLVGATVVAPVKAREPEAVREETWCPLGQRVHLIGIGGCGMRGAAAVLLREGALVSGSDRTDSGA